MSKPKKVKAGKQLAEHTEKNGLYPRSKENDTIFVMEIDGEQRPILRFV